MKDKWFALLPLSKETFIGTRTKQGERFVERLLSLRQPCQLLGKRTYPCLTDVFEDYSSASESVALFADARAACRSVNLARALPLPNSTYLLLRKQTWQTLYRGCFLSFSSIALGDNTAYRKECDVLRAVTF